MKKFIYKLLIVINFIAIIPLLISYLSAYVSPAKISTIALFGLGYPYFLVVNLVFILYWLYRKRWAFLFSLVALLIGWNFAGRIFQININNEQKISGEEFSLFCYNVRYFDKYHWSNHEETATKMVNLINEKQADIVCLQEIASNSRLGMRQHPQMKKLTGNKHVHVDYARIRSVHKTNGIATLSRFPIVGKGVIQFDGSTNVAIYSDLKINTEIVRIYNLHLQSVKLDPREYTLLDSLTTGNQEKKLQEAEYILAQLVEAYKVRAGQADLVASHIESSPYPVIVCGDFNDSPVSYAYQTISDNLIDAFIESGSGTSNTYNGKFPSFRIDFILHSDRIHSFDYNRKKVKLSDHYPIACKMVLMP